MNIDKNSIKLEITHNEILLKMYHTDPLFRRTIDVITNHDVQESELLNIFAQLCSTVKTYMDKYENCLSNESSMLPITKKEKEARVFFGRVL